MAVGSKASRGIRPNVKPLKFKSNVSGMAQNKAEAFLTPDKAVDIINMHATEEGSWSADSAGYTVINDGGTAYESGAAVDGLAWFTDSTGADHLFCAINTKLKEIDITDGSISDIDASAGFTLGAQVDFVALNDVLFTVDGGNAKPRKWDGTSASDSAGWPISDGVNTYTTPKYAEIHQNRLVYLNFQGGTDSSGATTWPAHFAISDLDDGETFTFNLAPPTGGYINQVQSGSSDGLEIVGARSIHIPASNESQLVIFKARGTYTLTGSSASLSDADVFKVVKMNGNYGAINNRSIVQVGNDLLALNEFGVTSYSSTTQSGTIQPSAVNSDLVKDVVGRLNRSQKNKCWGIHLPSRREVWFFLPTGSSTNCNEAIIYKYPSPGDQNEIPKWSRRVDAGSKFLCTHGVLMQDAFYIGRHNGFVGEMFAASKYDTVAIPWAYEYPLADLGNEKQNKRVVEGNAHFKVRTAQVATVQTTWLGGGNNDSLSQPIAIETNVEGAIYGTGVYGTAYYGQSDELKIPFDVPGDGQRIKVRLSGNTTATGPEFLGVTLMTEYGNLNQVWS